MQFTFLFFLLSFLLQLISLVLPFLFKVFSRKWYQSSLTVIKITTNVNELHENNNSPQEKNTNNNNKTKQTTNYLQSQKWTHICICIHTHSSWYLSSSQWACRYIFGRFCSEYTSVSLCCYPLASGISREVFCDVLIGWRCSVYWQSGVFWCRQLRHD